MSGITWQAGKAYGVCADCKSVVRLNKPLFGSLHVCVTVCQKRGQHSQPFYRHRRAGWLWWARDEYTCCDCSTVLLPPPRLLRTADTDQVTDASRCAP